jgi:hypothetical protein
MVSALVSNDSRDRFMESSDTLHGRADLIEKATPRQETAKIESFSARPHPGLVAMRLSLSAIVCVNAAAFVLLLALARLRGAHNLGSTSKSRLRFTALPEHPQVHIEDLSEAKLFQYQRCRCAMSRSCARPPQCSCFDVQAVQRLSGPASYHQGRGGGQATHLDASDEHLAPNRVQLQCDSALSKLGLRLLSFALSQLTYWLCGESGTLLGAVREQNIIKFDNDLDIESEQYLCFVPRPHQYYALCLS